MIVKSFTKQSRKRSTGLLIALFTATFALMLTGCAQLTTRSKVEIPKSLTKPCPPLTPLNGASGGEVMRKIIEIAEQYYQCADRHWALVDAVK